MNEATLRQRFAGWSVALLIEALILFALFSLGQQRPAPMVKDQSLTTFDLSPQADPEKPTLRKASPKPEKEQKRATPLQNEAQILPRPTSPLPPIKTPTPPSPNKGFIEMSSADLAAGDISKLDSKSAVSIASGAPPGPMGPGEGPGGQQLYNVEWVREPTNSELAPYLAEAKYVSTGSSAMIACRMIANNRVDNCQSLGETPRGTGLAKALRLASWQFLVRPPRIGNKPLLGVWVRIRFDFSKADIEG